MDEYDIRDYFYYESFGSAAFVSLALHLYPIDRYRINKMWGI